MAELAKKLRIKDSSGTTPCSLYSTTAEAGTENLPFKVDGVNAYVAITDIGAGTATSGRILRNSTTQAIAKNSVSYNKVDYLNPGVATFTVPELVYVLKLEVAAGGGGGGHGAYVQSHQTGGNGGGPASPGGAGGSGGLEKRLVAVQPNSVHQINVGAGGDGGPSLTYNNYESKGWEHWDEDGDDGEDGGQSSFGDLVTAQGGAGGGGGSSYFSYAIEISDKNSGGSKGSDGLSYGLGGAGGAGGSATGAGAAGDAGWVIVEYGGELLNAGGTPNFINKEWTAAGAYNFSVPDGVKIIEVETAGGGGSGIVGEKDITIPGRDGEKCVDVVEVTPGKQYEVVVGAGGTSGGSGGETSAFGVIARGGSNGNVTPLTNFAGGGAGGVSGAGSPGWVKIKYWTV